MVQQNECVPAVWQGFQCIRHETPVQPSDPITFHNTCISWKKSDILNSSKIENFKLPEKKWQNEAHETQKTLQLNIITFINTWNYLRNS